GLGCKRSNITADGNNDCNLPADEIGGQCSKPTVISLRPAVFDRHVAAFDKTGVIQPLSNDSDQECISRPRTTAQDTDNRKLLLRARRERPRHRAAEQRDELAALHHSITSSAPASRVGGMSRPSAFAVLRLITSSYLVGACTGRSAGFSPLRMRSTYPAARRYWSRKSGP